MSVLKVNSAQIGQSLTSTNNFTWYQPAVVDGTVRLGVGNAGATSLDALVINSSGAITLQGTANGVAYLNGSKVLTTGSALTFDGNNKVTLDNGTNGLLNIGPSGTGQGRFYSDSSGTYIGSVDSIPVIFRYANSEKMRLTSIGLGIGTTSPTSMFTVTGDSALGSNVAGGGAFNTFSSTGPTINSNIGFYRYGGTVASPTPVLSGYRLGGLISGGAISSSAVVNSASVEFFASENWNESTSGSYIYFTTTASGSISRSERMRIDSAGNLLVGTTTTLVNIARLQTLIPTGWYARGTKVTTNGDYAEVMYNAAGGSVGSIQINSSSVTYNTSSDYRLKENIQPMQNALAVVQQLNPVTYTWKADGSDGQGFIAHELQAVVPDCVTGEKDAVDKDGNPVYQGVDTSFLVATLTKAIQEQQELINKLTARVAQLEK